MYFELFHGRSAPDEQLEDWGTPGPIFGPLDYVHTTYATHVRFAPSDPSQPEGWLTIVDDLLYYDGVYYGDWSTFEGLTEDLSDRLIQFDEAKAQVPKAIVTQSETETIANILTAITGFAFTAQNSREGADTEQALRQIVEAGNRGIALYHQYYLLRLEGGIEPQLIGPFPTEEERGNGAIALQTENDTDVILAVDGPAASIRIEAYGPDFFNRK